MMIACCCCCCCCCSFVTLSTIKLWKSLLSPRTHSFIFHLPLSLRIGDSLSLAHSLACPTWLLLYNIRPENTNGKAIQCMWKHFYLLHHNNPIHGRKGQCQHAPYILHAEEHNNNTTKKPPKQKERRKKERNRREKQLNKYEMEKICFYCYFFSFIFGISLIFRSGENAEAIKWANEWPMFFLRFPFRRSTQLKCHGYFDGTTTASTRKQEQQLRHRCNEDNGWKTELCVLGKHKLMTPKRSKA